MGADITVRDDEARSRYLAERGEEVLGFAAYRRVAAVTTFTHTIVQPEHEGQGVASTLVRTALESERAAGRTIVPRCPYVRRFLQRHPEYVDLVSEWP